MVGARGRRAGGRLLGARCCLLHFSQGVGTEQAGRTQSCRCRTGSTGASGQGGRCQGRTAGARCCLLHFSPGVGPGRADGSSNGRRSQAGRTPPPEASAPHATPTGGIGPPCDTHRRHRPPMRHPPEASPPNATLRRPTCRTSARCLPDLSQSSPMPPRPVAIQPDASPTCRRNPTRCPSVVGRPRRGPSLPTARRARGFGRDRPRVTRPSVPSPRDARPLRDAGPSSQRLKRPRGPSAPRAHAPHGHPQVCSPSR
jgi:hypothetical protein